MTDIQRWTLAAAGLIGAGGVAAGAAASHVVGANLGVASEIMMVHAAALVGLGAIIGQQADRRRALGLVALAFVIGAALFGADIAARSLLGDRLFPGAAPIGGVLLIVGWLALALVMLLAPRQTGLAGLGSKLFK